MDTRQFDKYRKFGSNIAYQRKDKSYTQLKLVELLNIDYAHMQRIETANVGVSLDVLFHLST